MEGSRLFSVCFMFAVLWCTGECTDDLVTDRMDILAGGIKLLSENFEALKLQISRDKAFLESRQRNQIISLEAKLKRSIKRSVKDVLPGILTSDEFKDVMKSQVDTEMQHWKESYTHLRRQFHLMKKSFGKVKEENKVYRETLQKIDKENRELITCSEYLVQEVTAKLAKDQQHITELEQKLRETNVSCNSSSRRRSKNTRGISDRTTQRSDPLSTGVATPSTKMQLTTAHPRIEDRSRPPVNPWRSTTDRQVQAPISPIRIRIDEPREVETRLGDSVRFICVAVSYNTESEYLLSWTKNSGGLPEKAIDQNGVLFIPNIQPGDEGVYTCTGSDSYGVDRATAVVKLPVGPVVNPGVSQSVQAVDVGDRIDFQCNPSGTPRPTVTWSKLEGALPAIAIIGEGILIIPEVRPEDAGIYMCTASSEKGFVQSRVKLVVRGH